ncbi:VOC family protein [Spirochaeta africana]|uniref:PhnB-like domain-containing protein n=1 Tax=Spirochaeta africana (strain ATCC 700263 / DSM 8902 / Z-7692) TaxID=889378 RepID=H9UG58_SPIAZ|nr:VOC family protein [Spirochaeta africana]AFG36501.1 hypothetical protein Spiaf_0396 [Spirochaeta africana DSM 8902]
MSKIGACIWLDGQSAVEAAELYTRIFPDSRITATTHYTEVGQELHGQKPGAVMTVEYEIDGFSFSALNGGAAFTPNPSISFFVRCENAVEVDRLWAELSPGGTALMPLDSYTFNERYGWIQDKFGVSYQLIVDPPAPGQRISPSLLFVGDVCGKAEEAMQFYTSVFADSALGEIARYSAGQEPDAEGTVMHGQFRLEGQQCIAMDSALQHDFGFTEGISLIVDVESQQELDRYWNELSAVPEAEMCGWLKDRFGVSWQILPNSAMNQVLVSDDEAAKRRLLAAMFHMKKIDIAGLQAGI